MYPASKISIMYRDRTSIPPLQNRQYQGTAKREYSFFQKNSRKFINGEIDWNSCSKKWTSGLSRKNTAGTLMRSSAFSKPAATSSWWFIHHLSRVTCHFWHFDRRVKLTWLCICSRPWSFTSTVSLRWKAEWLGPSWPTTCSSASSYLSNFGASQVRIYNDVVRQNNTEQIFTPTPSRLSASLASITQKSLYWWRSFLDLWTIVCTFPKKRWRIITFSADSSPRRARTPFINL